MMTSLVAANKEIRFRSIHRYTFDVCLRVSPLEVVSLPLFTHESFSTASATISGPRLPRIQFWSPRFHFHLFVPEGVCFSAISQCNSLTFPCPHIPLAGCHLHSNSILISETLEDRLGYIVLSLSWIHRWPGLASSDCSSKFFLSSGLVSGFLTYFSLSLFFRSKQYWAEGRDRDSPSFFSEMWSEHCLLSYLITDGIPHWLSNVGIQMHGLSPVTHVWVTREHHASTARGLRCILATSSASALADTVRWRCGWCCFSSFCPIG